MTKRDNHEDMSTQPSDVEESQPRPEAAQLNEDESPSDGRWRWVVCLGVFVVNFLTVGQQNSAGVVYDALMEEYSTPRGETGSPKLLDSGIK